MRERPWLCGGVLAGSTRGPRHAEGPQSVADFWFDPRCARHGCVALDPRVAKVRDIEVNFPTSPGLAILNENRDDCPSNTAKGMAAWGPVRVAIAARQARGRKGLVATFTAIDSPDSQPGATTNSAGSSPSRWRTPVCPRSWQAATSDAYDALQKPPRG